jgi:hypothetical protein
MPKRPMNDIIPELREYTCSGCSYQFDDVGCYSCATCIRFPRMDNYTTKDRNAKWEETK